MRNKNWSPVTQPSAGWVFLGMVWFWIPTLVWPRWADIGQTVKHCLSCSDTRAYRVSFPCESCFFPPLLPQPVCCLAVWVARNVPQLVSATVTKQVAVRSALASLGCRFGCSVLGGGAFFCGRELGCSVPLKNEEMGICITWVPAQNISLGGDINTNSLIIEAFPEMDQRSKWRTANAWKILVSNVWARIHLAAVRIPISFISFFWENERIWPE